MKLNFTKMHGIGNDYIYFNCLEKELDNPFEIAIKLSDRHFGVGGDGIVMICQSDVADAKMRMFNIDGSEGKMCGNAIRCVGKYLFDNKIISKKNISIETLSGIKYLELTVDGDKVSYVSVNMGAAILKPELIPVNISGDTVVSRHCQIADGYYDITCVSMGNPHCIVFVDDVWSINIEKIGPLFENASVFPEQVNTEFIKVEDEKTLIMRVWERGSGETWACGTGACAATVAAVLNGYCKKNEEITVKLRGGDLKITYTDECVIMKGPAAVAFEGTVEI